jgi:uncharacterized protein with PIN domain
MTLRVLRVSQSWLRLFGFDLRRDSEEQIKKKLEMMALVEGRVFLDP